MTVPNKLPSPKDGSPKAVHKSKVSSPPNTTPFGFSPSRRGSLEINTSGPSSPFLDGGSTKGLRSPLAQPKEDDSSISKPPSTQEGLDKSESSFVPPSQPTQSPRISKTVSSIRSYLSKLAASIAQKVEAKSKQQSLHSKYQEHSSKLGSIKQNEPEQEKKTKEWETKTAKLRAQIKHIDEEVSKHRASIKDNVHQLSKLLFSSPTDFGQQLAALEVRVKILEDKLDRLFFALGFSNTTNVSRFDNSQIRQSKADGQIFESRLAKVETKLENLTSNLANVLGNNGIALPYSSSRSVRDQGFGGVTNSRSVSLDSTARQLPSATKDMRTGHSRFPSQSVIPQKRNLCSDNSDGNPPKDKANIRRKTSTGDGENTVYAGADKPWWPEQDSDPKQSRDYNKIDKYPP